MITETANAFGGAKILFQANEKEKIITLEKECAIDAARKALSAIVEEIPADALTVATVSYVMSEMKELLYNMVLES